MARILTTDEQVVVTVQPPANAIGKPFTASGTTKWVSSNPKVATVSPTRDGFGAVVTAKSKGVTDISLVSEATIGSEKAKLPTGEKAPVETIAVHGKLEVLVTDQAADANLGTEVVLEARTPTPQKSAGRKEKLTAGETVESEVKAEAWNKPTSFDKVKGFQKHKA